MLELNKIYNEPCLETLSKMENESIDCVITSPPYWQLRDYGYTGQWGLEPTFQLYLENLWSMMDEIYRVLKPSGTVWINLGDTYNTISGGVRGLERAKLNGNKKSISKKNIIGQGFEQQKCEDIKSKCLLLIPHRFAIGCIERGWIMRNDCIWAKRNGMPESVTDRFSKKHEYFFFMVKSEKYFFDLNAIRDKHTSEHNLIGNNSDYNKTVGFSDKSTLGTGHEKGKNPGSVCDFWDVPTKPSSHAHYASYNDELLKKPILAGCPEFVCNKCGKPRENIVERELNGTYNYKEGQMQRVKNSKSGGTEKVTLGKTNAIKNTVIGLTDCGCNVGFSGGVVYDPFIGTGSTAEICIRTNRKYIGSEMSKQYCEIADKRLNYQNKLELK